MHCTAPQLPRHTQPPLAGGNSRPPHLREPADSLLADRRKVLQREAVWAQRVRDVLHPRPCLHGDLAALGVDPQHAVHEAQADLALGAEGEAVGRQPGAHAAQLGACGAREGRRRSLGCGV